MFTDVVPVNRAPEVIRLISQVTLPTAAIREASAGTSLITSHKVALIAVPEESVA